MNKEIETALNKVEELFKKEKIPFDELKKDLKEVGGVYLIYRNNTLIYCVDNSAMRGIDMGAIAIFALE